MDLNALLKMSIIPSSFQIPMQISAIGLIKPTVLLVSGIIFKHFKEFLSTFIKIKKNQTAETLGF